METHLYRDDEWVSIGAAAQILSVSPNTVRRYEAAGLISSRRTLGNQKRFNVGQLRAALAAKAAS